MAKATKKIVKAKKEEKDSKCGACFGTGLLSNTQLCFTCNGTGKI